MGKEWYWSGRSSKKSSSGHVLAERDTNNNRTNNTTTNTTTTTTTTTTTASVGCMCAVFQLFDFHQFQFASNLQPHETQPSFKPITTRNTTTTTTFELPEEPSIPKGAEAPRNSLKSEEGTSLSSIMEDEEVLDVEIFNNIQMGINQIKTSSSAKSIISAADFSSDTCSNSPGTKTPGLVARLMGLDILPETTTNSPTTTNKLLSKSHSHTNRHRPRSSTSSSTQTNKARQLMELSDHRNNSGTRSLPETPRISSARRSDVDIHHHRLSLQINKENAADDIDFSRLSSLRRNKHLKSDHHQNQEYYHHHYYYYDSCSSSSSSTKSPGNYARQIVKQVKESVTRKAGSDITNTLRERDQNNKKSHAKPKPRSSSNPSKGLSKLEEQASRGNNNNNSSSAMMSSSYSSCSPRLKTSLLSSSCDDNKDQSFQVSKPTLLSSSLLSSQEQQEKEKGKRNKATASGGGGDSRRTMVQKIMQEETFVFGRQTYNKKTDQSNNYKRANINIPDKIKCKIKTPLSNNLLNINVVPTLLAVKKTTIDDIILVHNHLKPQKIQSGSDDAQESKRTTIMSTSHSYSSQSQDDRHVSVSRDTSSSRNDAVAALRQYITKILGRTGISPASHVSLSNWFSPSHPLDPSIFHRMELHYSNDDVHDKENDDKIIYRGNSRQIINRSLIGPRCNRKLAFDVVDELLAEILRPCMNLKPWITDTTTKPRTGLSIGMQGKDLIETLCSMVDGFPCRDCHALEDIDALIDQDLCDRQTGRSKGIAFEEEGEALVTEIEKDLVDTLVHETALILIAN